MAVGANQAEARSKPEVLLEWRVWLARQNPRKAIIAILLTIFASLIVSLAFNPAFGLVAALLLLLSTREFFLPISYRLTQEGAHVRYLAHHSFIAWEDVKARYITRDGLKLSPLSRPSRLESFRGVFLSYGDFSREVETLVKEKAIKTA